MHLCMLVCLEFLLGMMFKQFNFSIDLSLFMFMGLLSRLYVTAAEATI